MLKSANILNKVVIEAIHRAVNTGDCILVLNGVILTHKRNPIHVEPGTDQQGTKILKFFSYARSESTRYRDYLSTSESLTIQFQILETKLEGVDFTDWCDNFLSAFAQVTNPNTQWADKVVTEVGELFGIKKHARLKCLFVNTLPYQMFLTRALKPNTPASFPTPINTDGWDLTSFLWKIRSSAFNNLLKFYERQLKKKIRSGFGINSFYLTSYNIFSLVLFQVPGLFNPLLEDSLISSLLGNSKFMHLWEQRATSSHEIKFMFASSYEICTALGIPRIVGLDFPQITRLVQGVVTPTFYANEMVPSVRNRIMRLNQNSLGGEETETLEGYKKFMTIQEYQSNPVLQGLYIESDAMHSFILRNYRHFVSQGIRQDLMLREMFDGVQMARQEG